MPTESYRLSEIAPRLRGFAPELSEEQLARRVQNWTDARLLQPVGTRHSGRGVHRRFDQHELFKAGVLLELARYHVPTSVLERAAQLFDDVRPERPRRSGVGGPSPVRLKDLDELRRFWADCVSGRHNVYMIMLPMPHGAPDVTFGYRLAMPDAAVSLVAVNMTAVVRRLE